MPTSRRCRPSLGRDLNRRHCVHVQSWSQRRSRRVVLRVFLQSTGRGKCSTAISRIHRGRHIETQSLNLGSNNRRKLCIECDIKCGRPVDLNRFQFVEATQLGLESRVTVESSRNPDFAFGSLRQPQREPLLYRSLSLPC